MVGTWTLDGSTIEVAWFPGADRVPRPVLTMEVDRIGAILGRDLPLKVVGA